LSEMILGLCPGCCSKARGTMVSTSGSFTVSRISQ
jgi:hypothetical protein